MTNFFLYCRFFFSFFFLFFSFLASLHLHAGDHPKLTPQLINKGKLFEEFIHTSCDQLLTFMYNHYKECSAMDKSLEKWVKKAGSVEKFVENASKSYKQNWEKSADGDPINSMKLVRGFSNELRIFESNKETGDYDYLAGHSKDEDTWDGTLKYIPKDSLVKVRMSLHCWSMGGKYGVSALLGDTVVIAWQPEKNNADTTASAFL